METIKSLLKPEVLYIGDNGAVFHGRCAGMTARTTGRDLRGQRVVPLPATEKGFHCERC